VVRGVVADASEDPLKARLVLTDMEGDEVVGVYNTNEQTGRYIMVLTPGQRYALTVEAPGFAPQHSELYAKAQVDGSRELPLNIVMLTTDQRDRLTKND
jgi:hypothetical protein